MGGRRLRWCVAFLAVAGLALGGCGYRYDVPEVSILSTSPELTSDEAKALKELQPKSKASGLEPFDVPPPDPNVRMPRVGEKVAGIVTVTPELGAAITAYLRKDADAALAALNALEDKEPGEFLAYTAAALRVQTLLVTLQPFKALKAMERLAKRERALFRTNLDVLTRTADIHLWNADLDAAEAFYARAIVALGKWRLPNLYLWPPSNVPEIAHAAGGQTKAMLGIAATYLLKGDYRAALAWAEEAEGRVLDAFGIFDHPVYGLFAKPNATFYMFHGWTLSVFAAARVAVSRNLAASEHLFAAAEAYFEQGESPDGDLAVESLRNYVAVKLGLVETLTASIGMLPEPRRHAEGDVLGILRQRPKTLGAREEISLAIPAKGSIEAPRAGTRSIYGFEVTQELERAVDAYLKGDGEAALKAITLAENRTPSKLLAWHLSYLRAQVLIMMGRGADAEISLGKTEGLERAAYKTNLNTRALRGEARMWLGDYDAAIDDFVQVIRAMDGWRLPTLFVFPPPDVSEIVALTRATFRSYSGMAGALMFKGDYARALPWAEETEKLLEEVFYDIHHPVYGRYVAIDPDMFYARGINMGILGASKMALTKDVPASDRYFDAANAYFDALGYAAGKVTVDALRIRALIDIGRADLAVPLARQTARLAVEKGFADLVWRVEALLGEVLLTIGRKEEAERAFRRAQSAVAAVSGSLASDRSKRRFGIGKEDITLRLVEFDIEKGDFEALFRDLERGRARAFVDLVADQPVATDREREVVAQIREIDKRIRRQRLLNSAFRGPGQEGGRVEPGSRVLRSGMGPDSQVLKPKFRDAKALDLRREKVEELISRDPELAQALSISTHELRDIQLLLEPGEVIAYALPASGNQPLRFLIIHRKRAWIESVPLSAVELRTNLQMLRSKDPFREVGAQLAAAETLTKGLKIADWGANRLLYVVPSGDLYFVPWGALDIDIPVVILPTGGWLDRSPKSMSAVKAATVVGDPELGGVLPQLPGARKEAVAIGQQYGVPVLLGEFATEQMVRESVGNGVGMLHFATHGIFDAAHPLRSAIILSTGERPLKLTAARLFERPLAAKLVVLSACETGMGTAVAGDDFLGLARSFYLGGTLAVLNSLWPVLDQPTRLFMEEFHRHAASGDYGEAWLSARNLLKSKGFPPSIYGAFVLGGSSRG